MDLDAGRTALPTVLVSALAGLGDVAGSYALAGFAPGFVGPIAAAPARPMPGEVVTVAIVVLGDRGEQHNATTAVAVPALGLVASGSVVLLEALVAISVCFSTADLSSGGPVVQQAVLALRGLQLLAIGFPTYVTVR